MMARFKFLYIMLAILVIAACDTGQKNTSEPVYLDPDQPIDKRVEDLLSRMTLEEKVGQINWPCVYMNRFGEDIPAKQAGVRKYVVGDLLGVVGEDVVQLEAPLQMGVGLDIQPLSELHDVIDHLVE